MSMAHYRIERPDGGGHGYESFDITIDGAPMYYVVPGGTGACWNIGEYVNGERDDETPLHVCDIDAFVDALLALRRSDVHIAHVRRWEGDRAAARLRETR